MAQISYGTITITDTTDIERIYPVYCKGGETNAPSLQPLSNWSEVVSQAGGSGDYIWQRIVTKKQNVAVTTNDYSDAVRLTGDDGSALTITAIQYAQTQNENDTPSYGNSMPSSINEGWWLWVKTIYSDNSEVVIKTKQGQKGDQGYSVTNTRELYYLKTNSTTVPQITSSNQITNTDRQNGWTSIVPSYVTNGNYYTCIETTLNSPTNNLKWSAPVINNALTDTNKKASEAYDATVARDTEINALKATAKYYWWDSEGAHIASGLTSTDSDSNINHSTPNSFGYNALMAPGYLALRYQDKKFMQLSTNSLTFYKPKIESSTFVQGNKAMELSSSGLVFYDGSAANGGNIQAQFGSSGAIQSGNYQRGSDSKFSANGTKIDLTAGDIITQYFRLSQGGESGGPSAGAYIHGSLEALSGRIGGFLDDGSASANYWDIGNFTDYNLQRSAKIIGHGSSFIQLDNDDLTWRLANNRIHTGWYQPSTDSYLHFPEFTTDGSDTTTNKRRWDYGIHVPTSYNDKFLYIRTASATTDLSNLVKDLDDKATNQSWTYKFWIDGSGNVYAPNLYKWQNNQWTAVDAGGSVDSASKLSSYGGSSTQPVYFPSTGVPTAVSWDVKTTLNNKNDEVPTSAAVKTFVEGKGYITSYTETDPTVPSWAKAVTKPSYALSEITGADDVKAIEALTGTSGFLKKTAVNTWTLDTNTYLTSYTETDPIFVASAAHDITSSDISNWNSKTSNTGTVTKVTAGTGLKIGTATSGGDITTTGTINHINSVTAKTAAAQSAKTLTWGGTFTLYEEKYDAQGHVTGVASYNMTMPANPNTHNTAYLYAGKSDGTTNAATTNGNTYLILIDGDSVTTRRKISGSGTVGVTSDANGNITITGSAHPTSLKNPNALSVKIYNGNSTSTDISYDGSTANQSVSVAGIGAITSVGINGSTLSWTKADGTTGSSTVTITASVASGSKILTDADGNALNVGSTNKPVYFSGGVPATLKDGTNDLTIGKSVPSDAKFTDTWNAMVGATSSANGTAGYVSAPPKDGYNTKFLRADGTWVVPEGTYSLPPAANGTRGGVQIGYSANGKNYPVQLSNEKMYVSVPWTDTNYYHKTGSWNGLTYTAGKVGSPDDLAFTLPTGTTSTTVLRGDHTYTTSIEKDTSTTTSQLTLAYGTKYKLTTGGTNYIFTMPASDNTNTTYTLSGTLSSHKFTSTLTAGGSGSGTSTSDFTLAAGDNITLTDNTSTRTITIKANDTTYESKAAASGGTAVSLVTTGEKYTWNNKQDKLTNPVTGTGNSGYLVKWNGSTSVTNGPQLGSSTTTYLRNDGSWATPPNTDTKVKLTSQSTSGTYPLIFGPTSITSGNDYEAYYNTSITANPNTSTLKATNIETVYLKATNAKVTNILEANEVHTNKWTAANIANIGGSFYISPTMESDVTGVTISVSSDVYTFKVTGGTFSTSAANVNWNVGSRVMATGTITKGSVEYPIGTIVGILNTINSSSFTISNIASSNKGTLDKILAASGSYGTSHVQISMYQIGDGNTSSSTFKPVGILLTSYGADKTGQGTGDTSLDTFIDIYGGTNIIGTNAGIGGVDPNVRLGYLGHLNPYNYYPSLDTSVNTRKTYYTLSNNIYTKVASPSGSPVSQGYYEAIQPEGWGLYTDNGYFKGTIVANDGRIGNGAAAWSIGNDGDNRAYIYSKNNSVTATTTEGMYVGTDGILNVSSASTSGRPYVQIRNGIIIARGADITGAITATSFEVKINDIKRAEVNSTGLLVYDNTTGNNITDTDRLIASFSNDIILGKSTDYQMYVTTAGWELRHNNTPIGTIEGGMDDSGTTKALNFIVAGGPAIEAYTRSADEAITLVAGGEGLSNEQVRLDMTSTQNNSYIEITYGNSSNSSYIEMNYPYINMSNTHIQLDLQRRIIFNHEANSPFSDPPEVPSMIYADTHEGYDNMYYKTQGYHAFYAGDNNSFYIQSSTVNSRVPLYTPSIVLSGATAGTQNITGAVTTSSSITAGSSVLVGNHIRPNDLNVDHYCGTSDYRWTNVYTASLNASSSILVGGHVRPDNNSTSTNNYCGTSDYAWNGVYTRAITLVGATSGTNNITGAVTTSSSVYSKGSLIASGHCRPDNDTTTTTNYLGTSSYHWNKIYCKNATIDTSDAKEKDILGSIDYAKDFIMNLNPVQYQWKESDHKRIHLGFVAQEVAEIGKKLNKNLSVYEAEYKAPSDIADEDYNLEDYKYNGEEVDDSKLVWGLGYTELIAPLVQVVQDQQKEIEELKKRIQNLEE